MEKSLSHQGNDKADVNDESLEKEEEVSQHIESISGKNYIGDTFSSWKTWRGIEDEGSLEQRNLDSESGDGDGGEIGDKNLDKGVHSVHRIDAIVADSFTSYIRPDLAPKSWEMESAQPLMSSGQSRTHSLPRTRSLPEIRIPDDYDTVLDDKRETNSLQDNVITFLSADQLHTGSLKEGCLSGKNLHAPIQISSDGGYMSAFDQNIHGDKQSDDEKSHASMDLSNSDVSYNFNVHNTAFGDNVSRQGKRKLPEGGKRSSKVRRKTQKGQKAENLVSNIGETHNFVGGATMIIDQPISQIGGLYTVQISPANTGIQTVLQQQTVAAVQQPLPYETVSTSELPAEKSPSAKNSKANQQWFTSKDDKNSLHGKGVKWKQGMWSKEEVDVLKANIGNYCKIQGVNDPCQIIFGTPKDERKEFYKSIAQGISRPLFAVYRKTLRLYDNKNFIGKYSEEEVQKLCGLHSKYGNDWATIGSHMGRSAASVKDRCRLFRKNKKIGRWSLEEETFLSRCVREQTNTKEGESVTTGVVWSTIAEKLGTRTEKQCRSKWLNYLNWKEVSGKEWTKNDEVELIERISRLELKDENEINWQKLSEQWPSARSPQWLRGKWWALKKRVPDYKKLDFPGILDYLHTTYLDALKVKIDRQTVALASTFSVGANPVSLHGNERFTSHVTLPGLPTHTSNADLSDGDSLQNSQPLMSTSTIDLASLHGYQLQLQLASLSPHQLVIPVSSGSLGSSLTDHFIIPVNMTPAIITSSADQIPSQAGFIVQNVSAAAESQGVADSPRGVELAQALVQTDLSIPIPASDITEEALASANIQAISNRMVVSIGSSSLGSSAVEVNTESRQDFDDSIEVLSGDHSAVKVVKVDQIETQDLGSPL